jgi:hypothetical protein
VSPQQTRLEDPDGIVIDRKIPLWGILSVVGTLLVQAILMWNSSNIQAAEMRHQSEQIQDLVVQVKAMTTQMATKDGVDIGQDIRIGELGHRVDSLEARIRR